MENWLLGRGDDSGELAAGEWIRQCRPSRWEVEMTLQTSRVAIGDDIGDLAARDWRRRWRFSSWGLETKVETLQLGIGDDAKDLAAGYWRRLSDWGVRTTLEI